MYELQTHQKTTREIVLSQSGAITEGEQHPNDEEGGEKEWRRMVLEEVSGSEVSTLNIVSSQGERGSVWLAIDSFWPVKSEDSVIPELGVFRSSLSISTVTLYNFSLWEEFKSELKVSSWSLLSAICGTGYEGRATISKWYGIMETIHHYPIALGIAAASYTVFEIKNLTLYKILTLLLCLIFHFVLVTAIQLDHLVYGHMVSVVLTGCFVMAVYIFCASKFCVRAIYFIIWFTGI